MVMIVTALAAAVFYGIGAAVQQRQAGAEPRSLAGRPGLLVRLAHNPLWVAGFAVQVGGFAAHALALKAGPLTAVQMVMSADLVVAVLMVRVWSGRPLSRSSWSAVFTVIAGIALFVALTSHGGSHAAGRPGHVLRAVIVTSVAVGIVFLGERFRTGIADGIEVGIVVLITIAALARLARSAPHPEQAAAREPALVA